MRLRSRARNRYALRAISALGLALLVAGLALAAGGGTWHSANNLSNLPGRSFQTTAARNPVTGDLYVAWTEDGATTWEEIMLRRWDSATGVWLAAENISQSPEWARDGGPVLIFDAQGHGLLIWTRTYSASAGAPASGHDVLWRAWDGTSWSAEAVLMHDEAYLPGSPGTMGLIPVRASDSIRLFIVWGNGYRTAEYQSGTWSPLTPWDYSLTVSLAGAVADDAGLLHVAAFGPNSIQWGYNYWFDDAYYLTYDKGTWSAAENLSYTDGVADTVSLAFDGQGRLHFLWSDPDSPYSDESLKSAIWERVYEDGAWTPNAEVTADNPDQAIDGFSLVAGGDGNLHLAWSEGLLVEGVQTGVDIHYQAGDGTTWGAETKVYTSTAASRYPIVGETGEGPYALWQEVFWAGGPLYDHEVYFSRQIAEEGPIYQTYLPLAGNGGQSP
ncbi:MAG: hypothetical protein PVF47_11520 [Anaerolineae bacterium]